MRATELQLGDYVNYRGQIIKVTSLYDKGGSNEVGWGIKEDTWVNAINVEPIPLTPEILEKNGFYKEFDCDVIYYVHDNPLIKVEVGNNYRLYEDNRFYIKGIFAQKFYYVHELQHAMRIMGCDKEIEL